MTKAMDFLPSGVDAAAAEEAPRRSRERVQSSTSNDFMGGVRQLSTALMQSRIPSPAVLFAHLRGGGVGRTATTIDVVVSPSIGVTRSSYA